MTVILSNSLNIGSFVPLDGDIKLKPVRNLISVSKHLDGAARFPSSCLALSLFSCYPHSAHRHEKKGRRFRGSQWGNKCTVRSVRINVEF